MSGSESAQTIFLPGASGDTQFWRPLASRLRHGGRRRFVGWPGFGALPADPQVSGIADLAARLTLEITDPVDIFAQSMGGIVALLAALERPDLVRHLVLSATSGGIDMSSLRAFEAPAIPPIVSHRTALVRRRALEPRRSAARHPRPRLAAVG